MNFNQEIPVVVIRGPREPWIFDLCRARKVLHVGCADTGIPAESTLHLKLRDVAAELHGCDVDAEALEHVRGLVPGRYFTSMREAVFSRETYDIVIAPEVVEHVRNAGEFLDDLFAVPAAEHLVTAPCATGIQASSLDGNTWTEVVHADHRAWYSPYTLRKIMEPYCPRCGDLCTVYFLQDCNMVAVQISGGCAA